MRQITFGKKMKALELYLGGFSTNEIVNKTGISKGAVISIIQSLILRGIVKLQSD